ncbi:MAG: hypothetical protein JSS42_00845 [Proteobacteria bacterium]|nr:hypothetical protein [Pseudomonadota bacterium]
MESLDDVGRGQARNRDDVNPVRALAGDPQSVQRPGFGPAGQGSVATADMNLRNFCNIAVKVADTLRCDKTA